MFYRPSLPITFSIDWLLAAWRRIACEIVYVSLALCIIFSCFSMFAWAESFGVLTYNIRYDNKNDGDDIWSNRKDTVLETILQADIVGLQEVVSSQFDYISEGSEDWQWYGVGRNDGMRLGEMTPIGWRMKRFVAIEQGTFWLSDHPQSIGKAGWDAALPRIASWVRLVDRQTLANEQPQTVLVVNAHFDHRGANARHNSAAQLRRWMAQYSGNSAGIIIGDLNARSDSPPLQQLTDATIVELPALRDARLLSPVKDAGPDSTWNGFSKIEPKQRIDHILLFGDRTKVVDYQTLDPRTKANRFASDHLPVLAILELSDNVPK